MGVLAWVIFGLVAGALAKFLMPGKDPGGFFITAIIGIAGAIVGGYIGTLVGFGGVSGFDVRSLVVAVAGAMVLLFGYRVIKRPRPA